jgi:outer membrane protein assembly factor BamD
MVDLLRQTFPLFAAALLLGLYGCGGSDVIQGGTPEDRFAAGMVALEDEDYEEAQELFNLVISQSPASEWADDSYFYLAETYLRDGDYQLAAFNFNRLRQAFPSSPFYRLALFKAAESYDESSRPYDRDQTETRYAIDQYQSYLALYQRDSLAGIAAERIVKLRSKLALKDFSTAELYWGLDDYRAALVYYDKVIKNYSDTEYYERAIIGRVRALNELDRTSEALETIDRFEAEAPESSQLGTIQQLRSELQR